MKKALVAALVLVIASLGLVACGSSSSSTSSEATTEESTEAAGGAEAEGGKEEAGGEAEGGASSTVAIEADPSGELAFTKKELTAMPGMVTVDFTNQASIPHNVAIESENGEQLGETEVISGGSDSTTVNLPKGTYTYYCTIPGHRQAGMEGTLVVK
jgi:plastocyanin